MAERIWTIAAVACLLCVVVTRFVHGQESALGWEEDLGLDMCPECRTFAPLLTTELSHDTREGKDVGADACSGCVPLAPQRLKETASTTLPPREARDLDEGHDQGAEMSPQSRSTMPSDSQEEDLTVDMSTPAADFSSIEYDFGVDMCPDCRPLPSSVSPKPAVEEVSQSQLLVPTITSDTDAMGHLGSDMCPEKGQPMYVTETPPDRHIPSDLSSVVLELQQLVKMQKVQLDQLSEVLQQMDKSPGMELKATGLLNEQATSRVIDDSVLAPEHSANALSVDFKVENEGRNVLPSGLHDNSASTNFHTGVPTTDGQGLGSSVSGITVARYKPAWSEHFSFLSAVKVNGEVSCLHVLPQEGHDGTSRYVVVGDMTGQLYIFLWLGDLLLDYKTLSAAPVTSMLSYNLQEDETILVTGHSDGSVLVHQVLETKEQVSVSNDGSTTLFSIATLRALVVPPSHSSGASPSPGQKKDSESDKEKGSRLVTNLEMYKVGKMRYTLVADISGKIQLFRDNGSLHGVAQSASRPLAFMRVPSAQRLVFLTEVGVDVVDLRTMQIRSNPCEGLNSTTVTAYAFDVIGRSKAHGFTAEGDLVSVALTGDMLHFECHVKKRRKAQFPGPFVPQALKGYLVAATSDRVMVFNTTLQTGLSYANFWLAGPTPLFSVTVSEIALSFLPSPIKQSRWPVLASNRDKLVAVGFGDGYVAIFRSNLPTTKSGDLSSKFWNSYIFVSVLVLVVVWQLLTRKRDTVAVANPEFPGVLSAGSAGFENEDNSRMGFGQSREDEEPRRFRSPTRGYVDPKPTSFGSSDSRRFRLSPVDTGVSYSARREPLFANTQPVGEMELLQR